jgi:hypothetical protein
VRGSSTNCETLHRKSCCQRSCGTTSAVRAPRSALFTGSISALRLEAAAEYARMKVGVIFIGGDLEALADRETVYGPFIVPR